jgi:hypothetical protein
MVRGDIHGLVKNAREVIPPNGPIRVLGTAGARSLVVQIGAKLSAFYLPQIPPPKV